MYCFTGSFRNAKRCWELLIGVHIYLKVQEVVSWAIALGSSQWGGLMRQRFRKIIGVGLLAGTLTSMTATRLFAQDKKAAPDSTMPKVGDMAPDFKLHYFDGHDLKDVSLSDYRGKKNVVLAFYIFAFTGG
jgi:hypothetical protein